ncbi:uncharacterized protein [Argopecten irradians]|uniref:uncharacterized protein n=1 Tax=Argopecten irradians TaxID=31199 RepID=UPI003720905F
MASTWLVFLLLLVKVAGTFSLSYNDESIEIRLRRMERDFSSSIQSLKSELKDTQDKLETIQMELDSTKAMVRVINSELLATQHDLKESRVELQATREELFTKTLELVKSPSLIRTGSGEDTSLLEKPGAGHHDREDNLPVLKTVTSNRPRISKQLKWATRSRRVSNQHIEKAFSAQTSHHDVSLVTHQTVPFPHVILNEGSAYDNLTGVFTCPEPGVYHFSVTIMAFRDDQVETELVVNGNHAMLNYAGGTQRYNQGTNSVLVRLDVGDRVWVRILNSPDVQTDGDIRIYGGGWTTFTGFMI